MAVDSESYPTYKYRFQMGNDRFDNYYSHIDPENKDSFQIWEVTENTRSLVFNINLKTNETRIYERHFNPNEFFHPKFLENIKDKYRMFAYNYYAGIGLLRWIMDQYCNLGINWISE